MRISTAQTRSDPPTQRVNVSDHLKAMAARSPHQRAVIAPVGRDPIGRVAYAHLTFRQLEAESDRLAHGLVKAGVTRGTRTIVMVRPCIDFFALTFAFFKVGAVPVMVDPGMGLKRMLGCLAESRAEALVGIPPAHVLRLLAPRYFKTVNTWITVGKRWFWGGPTLADLRRVDDRPFPVPDTQGDETAAILFTTGSTGPAKGVVYTHKVFDAQVRAIGAHFDFQPDDIDLPTFPLFSLFDPALGMAAVVPDMDPTKPAEVDPEKIIEAVENQGITNMFASPALLNTVGRYGKNKGTKLPSIRRVISAGAPVTPAIIETFLEMLDPEARLETGYGATEAMPVMMMESSEILGETRALTDKGYGVCIGRPVPGITVKIIRISDDPIPQWSPELQQEEGEIGEIIVRGDQVTPGYFERPREDALHKIKQGPAVWHRMGDVGWQDTKGRFWFCGRKSHRVVQGEKTHFTIPCEALFNTHPEVFRSALVGVGPEGHQQPVICIEVEVGRETDLVNLNTELLALAQKNPLTQEIKCVLFHPGFPVDIRHNAKIFREKLAIWAAKKIKS
ncbi:MAG: fatty acid CoA ligase family protein [Desulfosarcinaceae bacterium]